MPLKKSGNQAGKLNEQEAAPQSQTVKPDTSAFGNDAEVEHFGSREETQAALEGKIANQNTRKLHGHR